MKQTAQIILLFLFFISIGAAIFIGPWLILPVVVGLLVAAAYGMNQLIKRSQRLKGRFGKFLQILPMTVFLCALTCIVWAVVTTPWTPPPVPASFATKANSFLAQLTGPPLGSGQLPSATIDIDRRSLHDALQMERQKVALLSEAISLYQVALTEYQTQASSGKPDEKLSEAITAFRSLFELERKDPAGNSSRLLKPEVLKAHLERASAAIDKLETEGLSTAKDSQALRLFRSGIPNALNDFQLDPLYLAVTMLQDRLKTSRQMQLSPGTTYESKYDRDRNSLISEQRTTISLSDNPASRVDLTGFFSGQLGTNLFEEIAIQEDSSPEKIVDSGAPSYSLRPGVKTVRIIKRFIRMNAAERIVGGSLPIQLTQVKIDWPLPPTHAFTLAMQERGNSTLTWPFVVRVENKGDAVLNRILMPRYAVYFTDPAMDSKPGASYDELTPGASAGNLRDLLPDSPQVIRIELLPSYLCHSWGQKVKDYLAVNNMLAMLVVFALSVSAPRAFKKLWH